MCIHLAAAILCGCPGKERPELRKRTLAEARQMVLTLFRELDAFELHKQREMGLAGRPAVRMEASWNHAGQKRKGIIYLVDHPELFNVIYYTAPLDGGEFEVGHPFFQQIIKSLRVIKHTGPLTVSEQGDIKILRSPDLQLEIRYPVDWVYSLDEVNRALTFSGPKEDPTWLTTVNFSVIDKWQPAG